MEIMTHQTLTRAIAEAEDQPMSGIQYFLGIDPGMSGGFGFVGDGRSYPHKIPETEADTAALLREWAPVVKLAWIERVHSMPKQGVASSFKFGQSYGFLRGILIGLRIPFEEVTPQSWQKAMGCLTHGDKNVSKAKAQQLFPGWKISHATADAMLIAEACRRAHANGYQAVQVVNLGT